MLITRMLVSPPVAHSTHDTVVATASKQHTSFQP